MTNMMLITATTTLAATATITTTVTAVTSTDGPGDGTWNQFPFTISLESHVSPAWAAPRTPLFAVRYIIQGVGE